MSKDDGEGCLLSVTCLDSVDSEAIVIIGLIQILKLIPTRIPSIRRRVDVKTFKVTFAVTVTVVTVVTVA